MADEPAGELPYAVTSYVEDREIDLAYRLVNICHDDGNVEKIKTDVAEVPTAEVAADNSPVSETGTAQSWEVISPDDANKYKQCGRG